MIKIKEESFELGCKKQNKPFELMQCAAQLLRRWKAIFMLASRISEGPDRALDLQPSGQSQQEQPEEPQQEQQDQHMQHDNPEQPKAGELEVDQYKEPQHQQGWKGGREQYAARIRRRKSEKSTTTGNTPVTIPPSTAFTSSVFVRATISVIYSRRTSRAVSPKTTTTSTACNTNHPVHIALEGGHPAVVRR